MSGLVLHLVAMSDHGVNSDWWNGSGMVVPCNGMSGSCRGHVMNRMNVVASCRQLLHCPSWCCSGLRYRNMAIELR